MERVELFGLLREVKVYCDALGDAKIPSRLALVAGGRTFLRVFDSLCCHA